MREVGDLEHVIDVAIDNHVPFSVGWDRHDGPEPWMELHTGSRVRWGVYFEWAETSWRFKTAVTLSKFWISTLTELIDLIEAEGQRIRDKEEDES